MGDGFNVRLNWQSLGRFARALRYPNESWTNRDETLKVTNKTGGVVLTFRDFETPVTRERVLTVEETAGLKQALADLLELKPRTM